MFLVADWARDQFKRDIPGSIKDDNEPIHLLSPFMSKAICAKSIVSISIHSCIFHYQ